MCYMHTVVDGSECTKIVPSTGSATNGDEYAILDIIVAIRTVEDDATKPWFDEVYDWAKAS